MLFVSLQKKGQAPLLETASELFAVLDIWWKIVGLASFIFINFCPLTSSLRLLLITQLVNYETKRVIYHNRTTADQGSVESACSITAHQEQILPTRIAS